MGRIIANRTAAGRFQRTIRLTGDVAATVEYSGRLYSHAAVLVDGECAVVEPVQFKIEAGGRWRFHSRLYLRLPYRNGDIRAAVDARFGERHELAEFSLWVADVLVYAEEHGEILIGGDAAGLPLPSGAPAVDVTPLPIPTAAAGVPPDEALPRPAANSPPESSPQ
jgi:hypothetical protein